MIRYKPCPKCKKANSSKKVRASRMSGFEFDIVGVTTKFHCACGLEYSDYESKRVKCANT